MPKAFFVNSTYHPVQGHTDFGYYLDGSVSAGDNIEQLVEEDQAFFVEVFPIQNQGVHIRLQSDNRRYASELHEEVELRSHGLDENLYQKEGTPQLPRSYDDLEDRNESLRAFARYALNHGRGKGIQAEVEWDEILEKGREF